MLLFATKFVLLLSKTIDFIQILRLVLSQYLCTGTVHV